MSGIILKFMVIVGEYEGVQFLSIRCQSNKHKTDRCRMYYISSNM